MEKYTVAWICSQSHAAWAMKLMDSKDEPALQVSKDKYQYSGGCIAGTWVVVAAVKEGADDNVADMMLDMLQTFPGVRFRFSIGIGGAAPKYDTSTSQNADICLGDIVVGYMKEARRLASVFEYTVKERSEGPDISIQSSLNPPPMVVLRAIGQYERVHETVAESTESYIQKVEKQFSISYPSAPDRLYKNIRFHNNRSQSCKDCGGQKVVSHSPRASKEPKLHHGLIALGSYDMRNASFRDTLRRDEGIMGISKQPFGSSDGCPTLVITGICDYADTHKGSSSYEPWRQYATATAFIYAKKLLASIDSTEILKLPQWRPSSPRIEIPGQTSENKAVDQSTQTTDPVESQPLPPRVETPSPPRVDFPSSPRVNSPSSPRVNSPPPPPYGIPGVLLQQAPQPVPINVIPHTDCYIGLISAEDVDSVLSSDKARVFKGDLEGLMRGIVVGFGGDFETRGELFRAFTRKYQLKTQGKIKITEFGSEYDGMTIESASADCTSWKVTDFNKLRAARAVAFLSMDMYENVALRFAIYDTIVLLKGYVDNFQKVGFGGAEKAHIF